jgi:hypothetical protein
VQRAPPCAGAYLALRFRRVGQRALCRDGDESVQARIEAVDALELRSRERGGTRFALAYRVGGLRQGQIVQWRVDRSLY